MSKLMFVAFQPKSSNDYQPQLFSEEETYHWNDSTSWGEGFSSQEEAEEDWEKQNDEEDERPEILTIGSEYDGLIESMSNGTSALDSEDYAKLCIEEAADDLGDDFVIFENCPRGFANEMGFVAVSSAEADEYRGEDGYTEISREDFVSECERGGENHAECENSHSNPPCGSFGLGRIEQHA